VLVIVSLMAIRDYTYVDDSDLEKARVGGIADHSNTLAAFFVYYMFLFYGFVLTFFKKNKKVVWLLVPLMLCFRGIMVTFSRGAYLGFAAGLLTGAFFRSKILFLAMIAAGVFAVATPGVLPAGIRYRLGQTMTASGPQLYEQDITQSLEASASHRIDIWRAALRMIEQNPVWGIGYGAFPLAAPHYSDRIREPVDAHNTYLLIAAEMGIPTLAVFLVVLLIALYYTWWLYRKTQDLWMKAIALGFLAGLGGLLVVNMFGSRMDDQAVASYFWILCALIMRGVHMERQEMKQARLSKAKPAAA
jgi:O-antigen ligase